MAITNESDAILELVSNINILDSKCSQFLGFALCFYLFRSCERYNVSDPASGAQLSICKEQCAGVDKLHQECTNKSTTEILRIDDSETLQELVSFADGFECSNHSTYIVPQVPVSNRSCDDVSYINHLFPKEGKLYYTGYLCSPLKHFVKCAFKLCSIEVYTVIILINVCR